jgi:hypothetical protein
MLPREDRDREYRDTTGHPAMAPGSSESRAKSNTVRRVPTGLRGYGARSPSGNQKPGRKFIDSIEDPREEKPCLLQLRGEIRQGMQLFGTECAQSAPLDRELQRQLRAEQIDGFDGYSDEPTAQRDGCDDNIHPPEQVEGENPRQKTRGKSFRIGV